jgi:hypothetical protein
MISKIFPVVNYYSTDDWIVPDDTDAVAAIASSVAGVSLSAGPHDAFAYDPDAATSSAFDVRFETGEAFVGGRYLVSDDITETRVAVDGSTVPVHRATLASSTTGQVVSIGPDDRGNSVATDQFIIGLDGDFPAASTPRLPIYEFDTDSSGVTSVTDRRPTTRGLINPDGGFDRVVRTLGDLQAIFSAPSAGGELAPGDSVLVTDDGAPYRTTQYLDIDVSDVDVHGRGQFPLVRPADGSNVGGFRVGANVPDTEPPASGVTISGVSFDGNPENQTANSGGFAFGTYRARNVELANCEARKTWPFREHNQTNSGVMIYDGTINYTVRGCEFLKVGDRAITASGAGGRIVNNYSRNGYDRMVSLAGAGGGATTTTVANNVLRNNAEGSVIGVAGNNPADRLLIHGNQAFGSYRCLVTVQNLDTSSSNTRILIANNLGINDGSGNPDNNRYPGIRIQQSNVKASGNYCVGNQGQGVHIRPESSSASVTNVDVTDNHFEGCTEHGALIDTDVSDCRLAENTFRDNNSNLTGISEIVVNGTDNLITNNYIPSTNGASPFEDGNAGSGGNNYVGNVSNVGTPRQLYPPSDVRNNDPPVATARGETDGNSSGSITVGFGKKFTQRPRLVFGRTAGGIGDVSFTTDANGRIDGAEIDIGTAGGTIDVFAESQ